MAEAVACAVRGSVVRGELLSSFCGGCHSVVVVVGMAGTVVGTVVGIVVGTVVGTTAVVVGMVGTERTVVVGRSQCLLRSWC